jgi:putative ABC transport system permease protein
LFTFKMGLSWRKYDLVRARQLGTRVLDQLERIPGVAAAALDSSLPLTPRGAGVPIQLEGQHSSQGEAENPRVAFHHISANYHQVMGIPLVGGRFFNGMDRESSLKVAIVSERLANRFWPGENAIGKRMLPADFLKPYEPDWLTVVGVVGDVKPAGPDGEPALDLYIPYLQGGSQAPSFAVRTTLDTASIHQQVLQAVARVDPEEPPSEMLTMSQILNRVIWQRKLAGIVSSILGGLALLLATIGVYGVISFNVNQRFREIGIRAALGAGPRDLLGMVAAEGIRFVAPGIVIGVALGVALGRAASALLFVVSPYDAVTLGGVALVLAALAACACVLPARRAMRLDPLRAMKAE